MKSSSQPYAICSKNQRSSGVLIQLFQPLHLMSPKRWGNFPLTLYSSKCYTFFRIPYLSFNQEKKNRWSNFSVRSLNSVLTINIKICTQRQKFNGLVCRKGLKRTLGFLQPKRCVHKRLIYQFIFCICQILFLLQHIELPLLEIDSWNVLNVQLPITR